MKNTHSRRLVVVCLSATFALSAFTACQSNQSPTPKQQYSTDVAYSASQYTMFLNKEITTVTNQLTTQMAMADGVAHNSSYPIEDAIKSVDSSIKIMDECIENVDEMFPPADYYEDRENLLECMKNTKSTLETYRDAIKSKPIDTKKIEELIKIMEGDYLAITAISNIYWEK